MKLATYLNSRPAKLSSEVRLPLKMLAIGLVFGVLVLGLAGIRKSVAQQTAPYQEFSSTPDLTSSKRVGSISIPSALVTIAESVNVPVQQAGLLAEVKFREGELVLKGDSIAHFQDTERVAALNRIEVEMQIAKQLADSKVDVEYARRTLGVAAANLARSERANQRVANSNPVAKIEKEKLERDRAQSLLTKAQQEQAVAKLKLELVKRDWEMAQTQLQKTNIVSPADGMIVAVNARPGEWVEPGQTLVRIVRVDRLRVEGLLAANQARQLSVGMDARVIFNVEWVKEPIVGKVVFINPEANQHNMKIQVWVEIDNTDQKLIPGMRGDLVFDSVSFK